MIFLPNSHKFMKPNDPSVLMRRSKFAYFTSIHLPKTCTFTRKNTGTFARTTVFRKI